MHNVKIAIYVLFGKLTEDYSPRDSFSESLEELLLSGKGGARMYRSFFAEKRKVIKHQKITGKLRKQTSQVNDFLFIGKCKSLGSLKLLLRCTS